MLVRARLKHHCCCSQLTIHDLQTYLPTFIDNIVILAIENCLLIPLGDIFTSLAVSRMEPETIQSLAEEPPHVQADRNRYSSQLEKLEAGLKTLNILNRENSSLSTPIVFGMYSLRKEMPRCYST